MKKALDRSEYIHLLNQLMTVSCILAGFAFSGLIALPSIDKDLYKKIVEDLNGEFNLAFYCSFYTLFLGTLCFIATIMTVLVYKVNNYFIPIRKLRRVYLVANGVFSIAIAALMTSVICFGIPSIVGMVLAFFTGIGVAGNFLWENLCPWQKRKREKEMEQEQT